MTIVYVCEFIKWAGTPWASLVLHKDTSCHELTMISSNSTSCLYIARVWERSHVFLCTSLTLFLLPSAFSHFCYHFRSSGYQPDVKVRPLPFSSLPKQWYLCLQCRRILPLHLSAWIQGENISRQRRTEGGCQRQYVSLLKPFFLVHIWTYNTATRIYVSLFWSVCTLIYKFD